MFANIAGIGQTYQINLLIMLMILITSIIMTKISQHVHYVDYSDKH